MGRTLTPIIVAVVIAVALVVVAGMVTDTAVDIKNKGYVTVKGFAKQPIRSDLGIFEATIVVEDPDLKKCYEKLAQDKEKVRAFLESKHAVSEGEMEFKPAWIKEIFVVNEEGYDTHELARYALKQNFKVKSSDVDKIAGIASDIVEILEQIVEILEQDVRLAIGDPEYIYTKLDDLKVEMIGEAIDNARQRAQVIAERGNFALGSVSNVRTGVFQITPVNSTEVSDYGMNDTSSIDKEIKSVVEIKYFVE